MYLGSNVIYTIPAHKRAQILSSPILFFRAVDLQDLQDF